MEVLHLHREPTLMPLVLDLVAIACAATASVIRATRANS